MPILRAKLEGMPKLKRQVAKLEKKQRRAFARLVARTTLGIEQQAKQDCTVDIGILRDSISHRFGAGGLGAAVEVNADYGTWVEYGTRPHFPPVQPLEDWARRHGMTGAGYAIAKAIAERGTPARPFFWPAVETYRDSFTREARTIVRNAKP